MKGALPIFQGLCQVQDLGREKENMVLVICDAPAENKGLRTVCDAAQRHPEQGPSLQ